MTSVRSRGSAGGWLNLFAMAITVWICACSDPAREAEVDDGSLRGQLIEEIATFDDGTSQTTFFLRRGKGVLGDRELVFSEPPDVRSLSEVKVWGVEKNGRILVDRLELAGESRQGLGSISQGLIGATPIAPTKLAMVIVDTGSGTNITPEELQKRLFTNVDAVRAYYIENSFGMHDLTGKVVSTVLSYPMTTCDTRGMATALRPMIDADVGGPSEIYLWYIGNRTSACSWGGLSSGRDTYYNGSSSCVVLVQEPGHSFGLAHSSRLVCNENGAVVPILDAVQSCTHNEYGNPFDTMGGGCRHFSSYHKVYRTYLQKCNGVNVKSSGRFVLHPIEKACNGIQVLQVPMPKVRPFLNSGGGGGGERNTQLAYYLVELRSSLGYDRTLKPNVLINAAPQYTIYNPSGGRRGEHIWLLDMAPTVTSGSDGTQYALAAGQTFTDPAGGVSITTEAVSANGATIRVEMAGTGQSTCLDNTPITGMGPDTCGDDGGGVVVVPPWDGTFPEGGPPRIDASVRDAAGGAGGAAGAGAGGRAGGGAGGTAGAGTAGSAGAGTGGSIGTGGAGGAIGTGGAGTGTAGAGGETTGGAGTGGAGTGGAGTGGGATGTSGTGVTGTGGTRAGAGKGGEDLQGGCACRAPGAPRGGDHRAYAWLALAFVALARTRKTRRIDT